MTLATVFYYLRPYLSEVEAYFRCCQIPVSRSLENQIKLCTDLAQHSSEQRGILFGSATESLKFPFDIVWS